jgi:hypothetical protein
MTVNPIKLNEIARIAEILADMCDGDEVLFADMMEGEAPAHEIVQRLADAIAADQEVLAGIKERAADLADRKARYEGRIIAGKKAIGAVLRAARLPSIVLPEATWSVREGKTKLVVLDPEAVPFDFTRVKQEPDKPAINAAFENADELPNWLSREPASDIVTQRSR